MAITFSKALSVSTLLNAYNNNVVTFTHDNVLDATKCVINISGLNFEITPLSNVFRYNFKETIGVLINSNRFTDDILPTLVLADPTSLIYGDTTNTYIAPLVTYTITFSDDSTEQTTVTYKWLKSIEQLEQDKTSVITGGNNVYMLSPFRSSTTNTYDITYFEGYPFAIALYFNSPGVTTVLNQTNAMTYDFTFNDTINRLFFSDGRTTITIGDFLPLVDGLNQLKITRGSDIIYVNVTKVPSVAGVYVKWLNTYGGWNYWLFNCSHERTRKDKDLKTVNNDFSDVSETTVPTYQIGKTSQDTLTLIADTVDKKNQDVLNGILDSPRVYLFTGIRLTQVTDVSWLGVNKKKGSSMITDFKRNIKNYKIGIELPERYTMKL